MSVLHVTYIAIGGAIGAVARFGLSFSLGQVSSGTFPWGTLAVNLAGSFAIGVLVEMFDTYLVPVEWRSFLAIGFVGAFTTFSTFSLETYNLFRDGQTKLALYNIAANNFGAILLVIVGVYVARLIAHGAAQGNIP